MSGHKATWRYARVAVAALGVLAVGCHSNRAASRLGSGTVESEDEVRGHAPSRLGGPLGGAKLHGWSKRATPDMQQDINSMSDSAFVDYVSQLKYDTHEKKSYLVDAQCQHGANPSDQCADDEAAKLFIEPEIGAHFKNIPGPGSRGFIVARIINYDPSDRVAMGIAFKPHTRYWWVVNYNEQTHKAQSVFVSRNYKANSPLDTVPGTFGFIDCGHKTKYTRAEAKFGTCARFLPSTVASIGAGAVAGPAPTVALARYTGAPSLRGAMPARAPLMAALLTGGWISCPTGCCSTQ
jgi:hypothetical protein